MDIVYTTVRWPTALCTQTHHICGYNAGGVSMVVVMVWPDSQSFMEIQVILKIALINSTLFKFKLAWDQEN